VSTEAVMVCDERASDIYRCSHLTTNPRLIFKFQVWQGDAFFSSKKSLNLL
jgi:hypothetical protein